jgi:hypothetical protein
MIDSSWTFDVSSDTAVVTTRYVTQDGQAIRYVTHEEDPVEGVIWQFHSGNEDYRNEVLQLVRLEEILALDPSVAALSRMPPGCCARRSCRTDPWTIARLIG